VDDLHAPLDGRADSPTGSEAGPPIEGTMESLLAVFGNDED